MPRPIVILFVCLAITSCKEDNIITNPITPGKRDYVWTSDTLFALGNAQTSMRSMYGTSPNNVYVVGHCEVSAGRIWHYNGTNWQPVNLSSIRGGLEAIDGTAENNIWIVGGKTYVDSNFHFIDTTFVVHYDGASWTETVGFVRREASLYCVDVLDQNSLFAGGSMGILYRLNGGTWELYEVGWPYFFSSIAAISPTECYAVGHVEDSVVPVDSSGSFLFRFDGNNWQKIDSVMRTPGAPSPHMGIGVYAWGSTLYSLSSDVYRREGNSWVKLVEAQVGHMHQNSVGDIFAVGRAVWHFNGFNWQEFPQFRTAFGDAWSDCYTDGTQVFIVGNDNWKTTILHGK